jgi:eukaryotic-like serine/threonine-protein kinase
VDSRPNYVREGDVLAGKYRVERVLGEGGMGVVLAAQHLQLETRVAIKLLLPELLASPEAVSRFVREARAAARITNEHVVRVTDVGTLESGAPYMVMEYLDGVDLASALKADGPMSIKQAVELLLEACEALAEAHALGIVHRDLKPANLFWVNRSDGQRILKVLDFGISKLLHAPLTGMNTKTSALLGTPHYMSPEQMTSSRTVDARTDIWALGIILYQLLVNEVPFGGDTLPAVCISVATDPPPPIRSRRPDVSPALEAVILRCLQKDPNQRFASVGDFALALARFSPLRAQSSREPVNRVRQAGGVHGSVGGAASSREQAFSPSSGTVAPFGRTASEAHRRGRFWSGKSVPAALLAALVGGALWFVRATQPGAAPVPTVRAVAAPPPTPSAAPSPAAPSLPAPDVAPIATPPPPQAAPAEVSQPASLRTPAPSKATNVPKLRKEPARSATSASPRQVVLPSAHPQAATPSGAFDERE